MASNHSSNTCLLVASIDFGTTYSGWAFSTNDEFESEPTKAYVKKWQAGSGILETAKVPTAVLIKPDGITLEAFGYEAENRYQELIDEDEHENYYFFKKFKMKLYSSLSKNISRNLMLADQIGKTLPARVVFTLAIKYFVEDFHDFYKKTVCYESKLSEVHWVLTVPAIWTDQAKQFMREAAEKAGIEPNKLSIALEPEAASAYCRYLPMDKATGVSISALSPGTKYMILDAGGGTIDITVHEVTDGLTMKEVVAASGGDWGGTKVDETFEELIQDLVGKELYCTFKREQTEDWLELMRDFEVKKKTIHPENKDYITIALPVSLSMMWEEENDTDFKDHITAFCQNSEDIKYTDNKIRFKHTLFRGLFSTCCEQIVAHVHDIIYRKNLKDLKLIVMVGGYSESLMLQHAVRKSFPTMRVITPYESCTAILKGALICGHRPEFITERVLKYTYGVLAMIPFVEGIHPAFRRKRKGFEIMCNNAFDKHVEKGQVVRVGEPQTKKSYIAFYGRSKVDIHLYASESINPQFVDEPGCTKIGVLSVDLQKSDSDRELLVCFTFSGTEIQVEAYVSKTGEKRKVSIDFLG